MQISLIDVQALNANFIESVLEGSTLTSATLLNHHFDLLKLFENTIPEDVSVFQNPDWNLGFVTFIVNYCVIKTLNRIPGAMFNEALPYVRSPRELLAWAEKGAQITSAETQFVSFLTDNPQICDIVITDRVYSVIDDGKVIEADARMKDGDKFVRGVKSKKLPQGKAINIGLIYDLIIEKARMDSYDQLVRQLSKSATT